MIQEWKEKGVLKEAAAGVPLVMYLWWWQKTFSDASSKYLKEWYDELYEQQDTISRHTLLLRSSSFLWCTVVIITADKKHTILSHEVYQYA